MHHQKQKDRLVVSMQSVTDQFLSTVLTSGPSSRMTLDHYLDYPEPGYASKNEKKVKPTY